MRGEQGKEGADCDDGAGGLTGHLREGAQGLAAGIAVTAKRVLRFVLFICWMFQCAFCLLTMTA